MSLFDLEYSGVSGHVVIVNLHSLVVGHHFEFVSFHFARVNADSVNVRARFVNASGHLTIVSDCQASVISDFLGAIPNLTAVDLHLLLALSVRICVLFSVE